MGEPAPAEGAPEAPAEAQDDTLSEEEILKRMGTSEKPGQIPLEPGDGGLKGFFLNTNNYLKYGLVDDAEEKDDVHFSGTRRVKPYRFLSKQDILDEVKKFGFNCDFHPEQKTIEKYPCPEVLLMRDPDRMYDNNFVFCTTKDAFTKWSAKIEELREEVIAAFTNELMGGDGGGEGEGGDGGDGDDGQEENIQVRDLPRDCHDWVSETMEQTHTDVAYFTVTNTRPLMQVMISQKRASFGAAVKFSDSGENLQSCRPQKDPNFALQRKELEIGIQAVKEMSTSSCQTTWFRPVNASVQYSSDDFMEGDNELGYEQVDQLSEFLTSVSRIVEEALQTNETVDIFKEEFANLGEEEIGFGSKSNSNIKEVRNFHDVTYTKGKRIEWVEWVPDSTEMLACSCCDNSPFQERLENSGKASVSTILLWSFQDSLAPHAILLSPWEVPVFKFCPTDRQYLVGGLSSGQLIIWKLTDLDFGHKNLEKRQGGMDEEKGSSIAQIVHRQVSVIDESHKKPVLAIEWLPPNLEIERRGRAHEKTSTDGACKYFITTAGDGQVMIWDFQAVLEALNDSDFFWKPIHKIQLQRQDSGTEMGCCHLLYCKDRKDDKGNQLLTNFYSSTEEGELIYGDWAARAEEDRKPEFCKRMFTVSKTFRPMLSLERSPFFPDILLGVTDWAFYLWKDGVKEHLFQSCSSSNYFTRGVWSPTRPAVILLGRLDGGLDIWDFSDQSHKASLFHPVTSVAVSSMIFLSCNNPNEEQKLAIGDEHGHLHVLNMPKNLVKQAGRELDAMKKFLEREEARVEYFEKRRVELAELKETLEKQQQMAADKGEEATASKEADTEKEDQAAEALYKKLELECKMELGLA